jgi:hypothetical protein
MTKKNTLILVRKPLHLQFPTLLAAPYTKPVIRWNQWKQHTKTHTNLKECLTSTKTKLNLCRLLAMPKYISLSSLLFFLLDRFYLHYKFTVVKVIRIRIPHAMIVFPCTFIKYTSHPIMFQTEIIMKVIFYNMKEVKYRKYEEVW